MFWIFLSVLIMATRRHKCVNNPGSFCYICGYFTLIRQMRNITSLVKRAYNAYSGFILRDLDKKWTPNIVCHNCEEVQCDWTKGKRKNLPFGIPKTWREPKDHTTECYFYLVNTKEVGKKNGHKIHYSNIPSATRPSLLSDELPIPVFT